MEERRLDGEAAKALREKVIEVLGSITEDQHNAMTLTRILKDMETNILPDILKMSVEWASSYCKLMGKERTPETYMEAIESMCILLTSMIISKVEENVKKAQMVAEVMKQIVKESSRRQTSSQSIIA